jgi:TM2 domain-containing membrane protein YozV
MLVGGGLLYFILCLLVGYVASERGRSGLIWALISAVVSPLIGFIALLAVGKG